YSGYVRVAPVIAIAVGIAAWDDAGCESSRQGQIAAPVVTVAPDEFVLRDLRTDAARRLKCQAPSVAVEMDAWAGSEGNVIAYGCGYRITYYLRCLTDHQCTKTITE